MPNQVSVAIPFSVDAQAQENIKNSLPYVSRSITKWSFSADHRALHLELDDTETSESVQAKVAAMLEKLRPLREDAERAIWKHTTSRTVAVRDVFGELAAAGDVVEHTPGIFSFGGRLVGWMSALDRHVFDFATKDQDALPLQVPVSTPITDLDAIHFFDRTPQFAQFMCTPSELSGGKSKQRKGSELASTLNKPTHMCRSAVCLNVYPRYRRAVIPGNGRAFTVCGSVFRNEASNVQSLERLHEFTVRDVVYLGDAKFVQEGLQQCLEWFKALFTEADLVSEISLATDSFFADNATALQFHQLATRAKLEVRVLNPSSGNLVATGSLNNHVDHFAKAFDINVESSGRAVTGCVGWGIERLVFTMLSQHGLEPSGWPAAMRQALGER